MSYNDPAFGMVQVQKKRRTLPPASRFSFRVQTFDFGAAHEFPTYESVVMTDAESGKVYRLMFDSEKVPPHVVVDVQQDGETQYVLTLTVGANKQVQVHDGPPAATTSAERVEVELTMDEITAPIDITATAGELAWLNRTLQTFCPALHLQFAPLSNLPGTVTIFEMTENYLTLCLYHDATCVASIQFKPADDVSGHKQLEISSRTMEGYQGKKLNRLLKAAALRLANHMRVANKPVRFLLSVAINPAVVYSLLKTYNTQVAPQVKAALGFGTKSTEHVFAAIATYLKRHDAMNIRVHVSCENVSKAQMEFLALTGMMGEHVDTIACPETVPLASELASSSTALTPAEAARLAILEMLE